MIACDGSLSYATHVSLVCWNHHIEVSFSALINLKAYNFAELMMTFFAARVCQFLGICAQRPFSACGYWPGMSAFVSGTYMMFSLSSAFMLGSILT